jgi:ubiquinone/menaquinone biosynthesis C-methylase UbiE
VEEHLTNRYGSPEGAAAYRAKYERTWLRRLSHRREMRVVDRALRQAAPRGPALDVPCGAGRLVPVLLRHATSVTAVDRSPAMVAQAEAALPDEIADGRVTTAVASASDLPFEDGAFDVVVCHRLLHHLPAAADRAGVLAELARVAKRRVVLSFSDATTRKARGQVRRGRTQRRFTIAPDALAEEAAPHDLVLEPPVRRLNGWVSVLAVAVWAKAGS